jgi:hypothetical protein
MGRNQLKREKPKSMGASARGRVLDIPSRQACSLAGAAVWLMVTAMVPAGQTLGEVAKKEEARRKAVTARGKVYTNDDLRGDITKAPPPASTPTSSDAPAPSKPEAATPGSQATQPGGSSSSAKDEAYWGSRIRTARGAVERSRIFADALQSRLNALATDIVNRDDPAQRSQLELERQRTLAELDRVKEEIADQTKAIADIEEEARKAGVPPGWLR